MDKRGAKELQKIRNSIMMALREEPLVSPAEKRKYTRSKSKEK